MARGNPKWKAYLQKPQEPSEEVGSAVELSDDEIHLLEKHPRVIFAGQVQRYRDMPPAKQREMRKLYEVPASVDRRRQNANKGRAHSDRLHLPPMRPRPQDLEARTSARRQTVQPKNHSRNFHSTSRR